MLLSLLRFRPAPEDGSLTQSSLPRVAGAPPGHPGSSAGTWGRLAAAGRGRVHTPHVPVRPPRAARRSGRARSRREARCWSTSRSTGSASCGRPISMSSRPSHQRRRVLTTPRGQSPTTRGCERSSSRRASSRCPRRHAAYPSSACRTASVKPASDESPVARRRCSKDCSRSSTLRSTWPSCSACRVGTDIEEPDGIRTVGRVEGERGVEPRIRDRDTELVEHTGASDPCAPRA